MKWFKALTRGKKALVVTVTIAVIGGAVAGGVVLFRKRKAAKALPEVNDGAEKPAK